VAEEFGREPLAEGREVRSEIDADLPVIRGDADALSRAVWNLLENAAKYSARGTPIRIVATRRDGAIRIGVDDRGIGIAPPEQASIFQTFVRGQGATQARARGVGLGLALVKRIVEAHGGSVTVESEPGRGSTFTLVLPCSGS
jgi:signal transduction histidine kinase